MEQLCEINSQTAIGAHRRGLVVAKAAGSRQRVWELEITLVT